jgi:hypothetical protein
VKFGLRFIQSMRREVFALVIFVGVWVSLIYVAWRLLSKLGVLSSLQQGVFYASLVIGVLVVMAFTYRHTIFNLMKDKQLKQAYAKDPPLR